MPDLSPHTPIASNGQKTSILPSSSRKSGSSNKRASIDFLIAPVFNSVDIQLRSMVFPTSAFFSKGMVFWDQTMLNRRIQAVD